MQTRNEGTLETKLQFELLVENNNKVTCLSHTTTEKTQAKAKLNHTQKLRKLNDDRDKHCELRPEGLENWVVNLTDQFLT